MTDDDARWIARARSGEAAAFRHLVDANSAVLFRVCARIMGDHALAEDAVQETFFKAFGHLASFDGRSAFSTWLYRIAVNAALAQVRKRRHREVAWPERAQDEGTMPFDAADDSPTPDRHAMSADIRRDVEAVLAHWLAQMNDPRARNDITTALKSEFSDDVREDAIFALSELDGGEADDALIAVLRGDYPRALKKHALFWLGQSGSPRAMAYFDEALK